jgi:predicted nucleic acid-binding protein
MRTVFLDTVGLLALWDRSDQWHVAAETAYQLLTAGPVRLVTSTLILYECGNAAARRPYRDDVADLWAALDAAGPPGSAGAVDHVSFVLMADAGITEAFTNDAHFRAAGFVTLF